MAAAVRPGSSTGGSGTQTLSWRRPAEPSRNRSTHPAIQSGGSSATPFAPIPPASATAIASSGGQAPAIGASKTGIRRP